MSTHVRIFGIGRVKRLKRVNFRNFNNLHLIFTNSQNSKKKIRCEEVVITILTKKKVVITILT